MTSRVAVPVKVARLRVHLEKGRHWTAVDHLVLWALASKARDSEHLSSEMEIPRRVVNEIILNLMRAGWVELAASPSELAFRATENGEEVLREFDTLPAITRPVSRPLSVVIEPFQLRAYSPRDLRYYRSSEIEAIAKDRDVRRVEIEGDPRWGLTATRLHDAADQILAEAGRGETLSAIDLQASSLGTEFALFVETNGSIRGLPPGAPRELVNAIRRAAKAPPRQKTLRTQPKRLAPSNGSTGAAVSLPAIDAADIFTTGQQHREAFENILGNARYHVVIHSTFLRAEAFASLQNTFRKAAQRGAKIDILWGSSKDEQGTAATLAEAIEINQRCQADVVLRKRVAVHMRTTRSHAKLLIADAGSAERYVAVVGSCNWLYTGFNRVDLSVMFREPAIVAGLANELAELIFAAYPTLEVAGTLTGIARRMRTMPVSEGPARARIVCGDSHGVMIRAARDGASRRIVLGADRIGIAAEARALIPLIQATERKVRTTIVYSSRAKQMSASDERALKREAAAAGVAIVEVPDRELHGKFLLWDDNDIVISSLNWPSADTSANLPQGEIGIHLSSPGIAAAALKILGSALSLPLEQAPK
jgi:cardiolipin synthase